MREIYIVTSYITLGQFLKFIGEATTGGEVKFIIANNDISVNGSLEKRRGRKLFDGDLIRINDDFFKIGIKE